MPALILQKPYPKSRDKENTAHLLRRLQLWYKGDIDALLTEGRLIQKLYKDKLKRTTNNNTADERRARTFAHLMMQGKVKAALRMLSQDSNDAGSGGPLPLTKDILDILRQKHPSKSTPVPSTLVKDEPPTLLPHQIIFDQIDGVKIRYAALKIEGAPGPSGLDAAAWKQMCTSHRDASNDLCKAIAAVTRHLCSEFVDPEGLSVLVACRLIVLDKNPGVGPLGGVNPGVRGPHKREPRVMWPIGIGEPSTPNIQHICPVISTILINTYRDDVNLFIDGEMLLSEEGTTQVEHALSCSCGGYPSIRHNELRDITATLLTEVSNNVGIEPVLQKLSGKHLTQKTSISSDGSS
ncbi:hypothetical protein EMCRGX_G019880 [Ephydatia muelleri]